MSSIDERIVEMQFDNDEFEKNIDQSIQSLEKLKKSLKIEESGEAFQNIQNASKNVNFDHIVDGLDALNRRFSTTGIIGMQVIQSLTQEAIRLGAQLVNAVTAPIKSDVVQGGWTRAMNIEKAKFQLEGLGYTGEKLEAIMTDVNNAVSGTAYGLDEAALVASSLAASGIEAGEGVGQMGQALLAVSGMAAMTGKSYGDIGHIMTTIAGNGRIMGQQLTQFSTYGLNVAAELAKALGKTEQQIRDLVSKGAIDFNTFTKVMFDAYAKHAKNANKTLTGSISNVHAALKKIGEDFMKPLVENDGSLVHLVNTLRLAINEIRKLTKPFADNVWTPWIKGVLDGLNDMIKRVTYAFNPLEKLYKALDDAGISSKKFREELFKIGRELGGKKGPLYAFKTYDEFIDYYGNFRESLREGWLTSEVVTNAIAAMNGETIKLTDSQKELNEQFEIYKQVVHDVWMGKYGNGADRVKRLTAANYDYATIQSLVNKCEHGRELTLADLSDEQIESLGLTEKEVKALKKLKKQADAANISLEDLLKDVVKPTILQLVGGGIGNILGTLIDLAKIFKTSISGAFNAISYDAIYSIAESFYNFTKALRLVDSETGEFTRRGENIKAVLSGIFSVLKLLIKVGAGIVKFGFNVLKLLVPIGDVLLDIFGVIGNLVSSFVDLITQSGFIDTIFSTVSDVIGKAAESFAQLASSLSSTFVSKLKDVSEFFKEVKEALSGKEGVSENAQKFANAIENVKKVFTDVMTYIGEAISSIIESFQKFFEAFKQNPEVERFISNIERLFDTITKVGSEKLEKLGTTLGNIFGEGFKLPSAEEVATFFGDLLKPINDLLEGDTVFDGTSKSGINFKGILEDIVIELELILEDLAKFGTDGFTKFFANMDWGKAVDIASVLSFVYLIKVLADFVEKIPAGNIFTNLNDTFKELKETITTFKEKNKYENIKAIAASVAALAAVVFVLGSLEPAKLTQGLLALVVIGYILEHIIEVMKKAKETENLKDKVDKSVISMRLAASFLMLAGGIALIIHAVKTIADLVKDNADNLISGIIVVGIVIGEIIGAFWLLKKLKIEELTKGSVAFIALALAIDMIAIAIEIMSLFNPKNILASAGAIAIVIGAMILLAKKLTDFEPSQLLAAAGSALIVATAIALIGTTLAVLSLTKLDRLWAPLVTLGLALAGITAALVVLNKFGGSGKKLMAAAGAILLIALALNMLVPAIASLSLLGDKSFFALGVIAGFLATIVLFAGALKLFGLDKVLMGISLSIIAVGAGFMMGALGLLYFAEALPILFAGLAVIGTLLKEKGGEIALAVGVIVAAIISGIALATTGSLPKIIEIAGTLLTAFGGGIMKAMPVLTKVLGSIVFTIGAFLLNAIPFLTEILVLAVISLINSTATALVEHGNELMAAVGNLLKSIIYLVALAGIEIMDTVFGWIPGFHGMMDNAKIDLENSVKGWFTDIDFLAQGEADADSYLSAWEKKTGATPIGRKMGGGGGSNSSNVQRNTGWDPRTAGQKDAKDEAEPYYDAYDQEMINQAEIHKQSRNKLQESQNVNAESFLGLHISDEDKDKYREMYKQWASNNVQSAAEGTKEAVEEHKEELDPSKQVVDAIQNGGEYDASSVLGNIGNSNALEYIDKFKMSFGENALSLEDFEAFLGGGGDGSIGIPAFENVANMDVNAYLDSFTKTSESTVEPQIESKAAEWPKKAEKTEAWNAVGSNNIVGFINGMLSKNGEVISAARTIANNAIDAAKNALGQKSPSKIFHQIGVYNDQGLINGMLSLSGKVNDASADVADGAINSAQYAMNRIQSVINSDMDIAPTIRPVFDDSLLQNGINTMSVWGNGYALNLAGSIGSVNLTQGQIFDDLNKRLDSRFEELSDRIDRISDRPFVANLTTTLDGREIARGTATYTSEELNRITRNNNRKAGKRG